MKSVFNSSICCFSIFIFFAAYGYANAQETSSASEPVVVGVLHSQKFPFSTMMKNSFEMALEVINTEGGIKGRPLRFVYADDRGKREEGEKAVRRFVEESNAVMLVGGYASSNTIYMAGLGNKLGIPLLITTAADDRITQRKWKNIYRMNPPAQEYAKGVEELLLERIKPASMAIIYENSPYGTGSALRMMWFCRENDIEIRKIIPYHKERASSNYFRKLLEPLKDNPPAAIYMVSYLKDAVFLVNEIRDSKIDSMLIGGAGGFTHHKFITMAGDDSNGLLTATLWTHQLPYPGARKYHEQYRKTFSITPDYHGAEAYSAVLVVADVLKRAKSLRPAGVRDALDQTSIMTPFGPVTFKSYKNFERQNSLYTIALQVMDGKFEIVWPESIATKNLMKMKSINR